MQSVNSITWLPHRILHSPVSWLTNDQPVKYLVKVSLTHANTSKEEEEEEEELSSWVNLLCTSNCGRLAIYLLVSSLFLSLFLFLSWTRSGWMWFEKLQMRDKSHHWAPEQRPITRWPFCHFVWEDERKKKKQKQILRRRRRKEENMHASTAKKRKDEEKKYKSADKQDIW